MKTVTCVAEKEFTQFVEGYGMVIGAPDSSLDEAKKPEVPEHVVGQFIADGLIKAPKGWAKAQADEAPADPEPAANAAGSTDQAPA